MDNIGVNQKSAATRRRFLAAGLSMGGAAWLPGMAQAQASKSAAAAASAAAVSPEDNAIVFGQSCQLTGPLAALSNEVRFGASLYLDKVNAEGGIGGRPVRVLSLDDGYDPAKAAENTRRFIEDENVLGLFHYAGTPSSLAALPLVEKHRVPFVAPFTGVNVLRDRHSRYVFNIRAGYAQELEAMVRHLSVIGSNRIAAVYLNNAFGNEGIGFVRQFAQEYKVDLVAANVVENDGSNMAAVAQEIAKVRPQAVLLVTAGKASVDFIAAHKKMGQHTSYYMLSVTSNSQLREMLGDAAVGVVVSQVVPAPWNQGVPISREFNALAKGKGVEEYTFNHMDGFLSAKFLVESLRSMSGHGNMTREGLVRAMEGMTRLDLGGYEVQLSPQQHSSGKLVELLMVGRGGRYMR